MKSQKEETPEKPDFEKLAKEYFPDPRDQGSAISLLERIWRDYVVASKEPQVYVVHLDGNNTTIYKNGKKLNASEVPLFVMADGTMQNTRVEKGK